MIAVIPESGLVQAENLMTPTRVETKQRSHQIMERNTSKPWDTFWYTDKENNKLTNKPLLKQCLTNDCNLGRKLMKHSEIVFIHFGF